jgi:hypothetical protein
VVQVLVQRETLEVNKHNMEMHTAVQ